MNNLFGDPAPPPKRAPQTISDEAVKSIYALYPKKVGCKAAHASIRRALRDLLKEGCADPVALLMDATREYRDATLTWPEADKPFRLNPTTFYNQGHWEDDRTEWYKGERKRPKPTGKFVSGWEDKIKECAMAVSHAADGPERWRSQAALRATLKTIPPRLKDEPSIIAIMEHAEALLWM